MRTTNIFVKTDFWKCLPRSLPGHFLAKIGQVKPQGAFFSKRTSYGNVKKTSKGYLLCEMDIPKRGLVHIHIMLRGMHRGTSKHTWAHLSEHGLIYRNMGDNRGGGVNVLRRDVVKFIVSRCLLSDRSSVDNFIHCEAEWYSIKLFGLSIRSSVHPSHSFLILCVHRLRDYAAHNHESYSFWKLTVQTVS